MKIIFFNFVPLTFYGGFESNIINLANYFSNNHDVKIITGNQFMNDLWTGLIAFHKCEIRVDYEKINEKIGKISLLQFGLKSLWPFSKNYKKIRIDLSQGNIIYGKNEFFDLFWIKYFLFFSKTRPIIICGVHTPLKYNSSDSFKYKLHNLFYRSWFYKKIISGVKVRFLTLNDSDAEFVKDQLKIRQNNVEVIPNGINIEKFSPVPTVKHDQFIILFIGRMTGQKGVDLMGNVIEELSAESYFPQIRFMFAGSGELDYIPIKLSKRFKNVIFLQHVQDVVALYRSVDLVVAPSRWEGFPFTVLEAQGCGVPVIVSDIPGSRDIINNSGIIVPTEDASRLKLAVIEMFRKYRSETDDYNTLKLNARNNIVNNFSIAQINSRIEQYFLKELKKN